MTVGDRIKQKRKELGITQIELAKACGTTYQAISKYENDLISNIPRKKLILISYALGCTPTYLLGYDDPETDNENDTMIPDFIKELKSLSNLSNDEQLLLDIFRTMPEDKQSELLRIAMRLKMDSERK